jgi:hypothetical protein
MRDVKLTREQADEVAQALGDWLATKRASLDAAGAFRSPALKAGWERARAAVDGVREALASDDGAVLYVERRPPQEAE